MSWQIQHPDAKPLRLAYYGLFDPQDVGVEFHQDLANRQISKSIGDSPLGYYAFSVNKLHRYDSSVPMNSLGMQEPDPEAMEHLPKRKLVATPGYSIRVYQITNWRQDN